ncbi:hypothetical protein B0H66DRAFT_531581 [Apodospora peruviana]|uniref:Uncharacterized protein n=1 Tax=Apodospora peruviana TaxID=516989 RepID=A0AAE0IC29_9PEZI|nr:hypothetical protein B0H66DRAFT_531581 [Apodospora peruviana]
MSQCLRLLPLHIAWLSMPVITIFMIRYTDTSSDLAALKGHSKCAMLGSVSHSQWSGEGVVRPQCTPTYCFAGTEYASCLILSYLQTLCKVGSQRFIGEVVRITMHQGCPTRRPRVVPPVCPSEMTKRKRGLTRRHRLVLVVLHREIDIMNAQMASSDLVLSPSAAMMKVSDRVCKKDSNI